MLSHLVDNYYIVMMETIQNCWKLATTFKSFDGNIDNLRLTLHYLSGMFLEKYDGKVNLMGLDDASFGKKYLALVFENNPKGQTTFNSDCDLMNQPIIKV